MSEARGTIFTIPDYSPKTTFTEWAGKNFKSVDLKPGEYLIYEEAGEYWIAQKLEVLPDQELPL